LRSTFGLKTRFWHNDCGWITLTWASKCMSPNPIPRSCHGQVFISEKSYGFSKTIRRGWVESYVRVLLSEFVISSTQSRIPHFYYHTDPPRKANIFSQHWTDKLCRPLRLRNDSQRKYLLNTPSRSPQVLHPPMTPPTLPLPPSGRFTHCVRESSRAAVQAEAINVSVKCLTFQFLRPPSRYRSTGAYFAYA
jgi:hypothetical protein